MKYTSIISLALVAKAAAVVTRILDVVEVIHNDAVVLIDDDGTPWSTSSVVSTAYSTASTLRGLSASSSSASSHSHGSSVVEISIASSTASSSTPTSTPPTTFVTKTTTVTLGSATGNRAVDNSVVSTTASAPTSTSTPVVISEVATSTPAVVAEATTSTPVIITTTSSTTPAVVSTKETSAASSAPVSTATAAAAFTGKGTYYDVGLGACGWTNVDSDLVVALNADQFGTQSNGNPVCGSKILINGPSGSVAVTVVDKCPGCSYGSLDLSPSAFAKIADMSAGRVDISWSFT